MQKYQCKEEKTCERICGGAITGGFPQGLSWNCGEIKKGWRKGAYEGKQIKSAEFVMTCQKIGGQRRWGKKRADRFNSGMGEGGGGGPSVTKM